jgi:putative ABC transport system permease protein
MLHGAFLNTATARFPSVVLGSDAAVVLGIPDLSAPVQVDISEHSFTVVGILAPTPLTPALDQSVFVGFPIARSLLGFDGRPTQIYLRADPDQVPDVERVLAATTNPESPEAVVVARPSDVLAARATAKGKLNGLLVALGAVALLVAGIGIANVMVISVLERRSEIGLRRALGATRNDIALQFLAESLALAGVGGVLGVIVGVWATSLYAAVDHLSASVPVVDVIATLGAALVVGALAGLHPARRAARLDPPDALRAA